MAFANLIEYLQAKIKITEACLSNNVVTKNILLEVLNEQQKELQEALYNKSNTGYKIE